MGNITLAQNAQGHDANLTIKYMLNDPSAPPGVKGRTTAIVNDGPLEVKHPTTTSNEVSGSSNSNIFG